MDYVFTAIDAVYVWTRGGYGVARGPETYPLFIAVHETELDAWATFFDRFGIPTTEKRQPVDEFDSAKVDMDIRGSGRKRMAVNHWVSFPDNYYK